MFHNAWATYISADLNRQLPYNYFAEPNVQFGIEIDVATFEEESQSGAPARYEEFWTPISQNGTPSLEIWPEKLAVGKSLPTLPLWLPGAISLRVDLEQAYARTCDEQRM